MFIPVLYLLFFLMPKHKLSRYLYDSHNTSQNVTGFLNVSFRIVANHFTLYIKYIYIYIYININTVESIN